LIVWNLFSLHF